MMSRKPQQHSKPPASPAPNAFGEFFREAFGHEAKDSPAAEAENVAKKETTGAARTSESLPDRLLRGQKAVLALDRKRRRGKTVTTITGLNLHPHEMDELARKLRQLCGAGGTAEEGVIEVQGDQRDRLESYLTERGVKVRRSG